MSVLIIDMISIMDTKSFTTLEELVRTVQNSKKENPHTKPFGGILVIVHIDYENYDNYIENPHECCLSSTLWKECFSTDVVAISFTTEKMRRPCEGSYMIELDTGFGTFGGAFIFPNEKEPKGLSCNHVLQSHGTDVFQPQKLTKNLFGKTTGMFE